MVQFNETQEYGIYTINAVYNGEVVADYKITKSAIDNGVVSVYTNEVPLVVALWLVNIGYTNHGWHEIEQGALFHVETNRYTSQEMRWRIAKVRV